MKAVIKTNKNAAEIQLPCSRMQMSGALSYVGLDTPSTYEIRAKGISQFGCEIELYPQSQLDEMVLPVIKDESLEALNNAYESLGNLPYAKRLEVERKIGDDGIDSLRDFQDLMRTEMLTRINQRFYCPVVCQATTRDYWGEESEDWREENGEFAAGYKDAIRSKFLEYTARDECNMAEYFSGHHGVSSKLLSADWDFVNRNGCLYGQITCQLTGYLNEGEEQALKDWIRGQNSDGLGEGFEQQEVEYNSSYRDGMMYVSLWHSGDDYFIDNEEEFENRLHHGQGMSEIE